MSFNQKIANRMNLHDYIEYACDDYSENLTDQEFRWLVDGLTKRIGEYFKNYIIDEKMK